MSNGVKQTYKIKVGFLPISIVALIFGLIMPLVISAALPAPAKGEIQFTSSSGKTPVVAGDTLTLRINAYDAGEIASLGIVTIVTTVNGQTVGTYEKTKGAVSFNNILEQQVVVSGGNGFINGCNTVVMKITDKNKGTVLVNNTNTIQATGLGSAAPVACFDPANQLSAHADKTSVKIGDTINISIPGAPAGSVASYKINGGQSLQMDSQGATHVVVSQENGFNNSNNTITVSLRDSNGTPLPLADGGNIKITVGGATGGGTPAPPRGTDKLYNPLGPNGEELTQTFLVVIQGFLAIVGIWAVIFIIVGGFQMVMAAGNEETLLKAKKTITWAILGLVVALLSFSIVAIVENLLQTKIQPTTYKTTTTKYL